MRQFQGFKLGLGEGSYNKFLKTVGDFDLSKLDTDAAQELQKVFVGFKSNFAKSQGSSHQLLDIITEVDAGKIVKGIEVDEVIKTASGKKLGKRVYDYIVQTTQGLLRIENKAWSPNNIDQYLGYAISWKKIDAAKLGDDAGKLKPGQLYLDIVNLAQGKNVQWRFDPRSAGLEGEISKKIKELIIENKDRFSESLNLKTGEAWDEFLDLVDDSMDDFVKVTDYGV